MNAVTENKHEPRDRSTGIKKQKNLRSKGTTQSLSQMPVFRSTSPPLARAHRCDAISSHFMKAKQNTFTAHKWNNHKTRPFLEPGEM